MIDIKTKGSSLGIPSRKDRRSQGAYSLHPLYKMSKKSVSLRRSHGVSPLPDFNLRHTRSRRYLIPKRKPLSECSSRMTLRLDVDILASKAVDCRSGQIVSSCFPSSVSVKSKFSQHWRRDTLCRNSFRVPRVSTLLDESVAMIRNASPPAVSFNKKTEQQSSCHRSALNQTSSHWF